MHYRPLCGRESQWSQCSYKSGTDYKSAARLQVHVLGSHSVGESHVVCERLLDYRLCKDREHCTFNDRPSEIRVYKSDSGEGYVDSGPVEVTMCM